MIWVWLLAVVGELTRARTTNPDQVKYTEVEGRSFMDQLNEEQETWGNRLGNAAWDYASNLTDENLRKQLKLSSEVAVFNKEQWKEVIKYPWKTFKDPELKRQFKLNSVLGTAALSEEKRYRLDEVVAKMSDIYGKTKLLEWQDPGSKTKTNAKEPTISLEPDLEDYFSEHADDSCTLQYYWEGWHGSVGRKEKPLFDEYVKLSNEVAKLNITATILLPSGTNGNELETMGINKYHETKLRGPPSNTIKDWPRYYLSTLSHFNIRDEYKL